jgi:hypothetical protein
MGFFSSKPKEKEPELMKFICIYVFLDGNWHNLVDDKDCKINDVPVLEWGYNYRYFGYGRNDQEPPLILLHIFYKGWNWYVTNTALRVGLLLRPMTEEEKAQRKAAAKVK